jgi:hypothetical protein
MTELLLIGLLSLACAAWVFLQRATGSASRAGAGGCGACGGGGSGGSGNCAKSGQDERCERER